MGYRFIHLTTTHSNSFLFMIEWYSIVYMYHNFFSVQLHPTLWDPMGCSMPVFPVHHQLPEVAQTHVHGVGDAIQPSHSLLSLSPPAFNLSQHRVFSNEPFLWIRWPIYWSFSVSPSNEYSGLISFRIDCWISLQSKDSQESSPTPLFKSINSLALSFLYSPALISITWLLEKP